MTGATEATETPAGESLRRLTTLVSPYTGVIRVVVDVLAGPGEIPRVAVTCETAHGELLPGGAVSRLGSGSGPDRETALAAALGEAVERYSAAGPAAPERLRVGSAAELGERAVRPERFALFAAHQYGEQSFPYRPFTKTSQVAWIEGFRLPDRESALLPAQLVFLNRLDGAEEHRVGPSTSNGLACRATLDEAVLAGLFEVVERDAFMIVWANRLSLPRLSWERDDELLAFETRYLAPTGLRYAAVDLSAFWDVPTVLGIARGDESAAAALGVGAASATTVQRAVRKALDEAFRVQAWAADLTFLEPDRSFARDHSDIRDFDDHVRYYADRESAYAAAFLDAAGEVRDVADVRRLPGDSAPAQIEAIAERLESRGCSAYAVDVTATDIRDAGLAVAKVVAPELCPLDADHRTRFLGGRRLYEAAFELGLTGRVLGPGDLNPDPHPFP
jgi:ribosomal protein S12 methylthiotransferase accessory factor